MNLAPRSGRRLTGTAAALLALGTLTLAATSSPAQARTTRRPGAGYVIRHTGMSPGGWIGAYQIGNDIAYRISPNTKAIASAYEAPVLSPLVFRHRPASVTAEAEWILGTYGGLRGRVQDAAVDAAMYQMTQLGGSRWGSHGYAGKKRIKQTHHAKKIHNFITMMLRRAQRYAGPYHTSLKIPAVAAGAQTSATFKITSWSGHPLEGIPVSFDHAGNSALHTTIYTNSNGIARQTFAAVAGNTTVRATAWHLIGTRLHIRKPVRSAAPEVVVVPKTRTQIVRTANSRGTS